MDLYAGTFKSSLVHLGVEYRVLVFPQIKYYKVSKNRSANTEKPKLSVLVLEGGVVLFLF